MEVQILKESEIKKKIIEIIHKLFQGSGVSMEVLAYANFIDDLGMDSINFISLIIELETEFHIQIPDEWLLIENFGECDLIFSLVSKLITQKMEGDNYEQ